MLIALRDPESYTRSLAARALTRTYAEAARLAPAITYALFPLMSAPLLW